MGTVFKCLGYFVDILLCNLYRFKMILHIWNIFGYLTTSKYLSSETSIKWTLFKGNQKMFTVGNCLNSRKLLYGENLWRNYKVSTTRICYREKIKVFIYQYILHKYKKIDYKY